MLSFSLVAASALFLRVSALTPTNLVTPSITGALSGLKYTHVGQDGSYNQVTDLLPGVFPSCNVNPSCITSPIPVSGNLAPFDEDLTMVFRGPMHIDNIAVYQPLNTSSATWSRVSSWAVESSPDNMVFMNNDGGSVSGEWSICAGASQSYANGTWNGAAPSPNADTYSGYLPGGQEVNVMTATSCADAQCPGFSRGTANMGWAGSKMFVMTFDMPTSSDLTQVPAIWALNAQVVRSAQYGCNCRGEGLPAGCGELDVLETLTGSNADAAQCISEMYALNSATGTGASYFDRPTGDAVTYAVIFDVQTDSIAIQQFTNWDYTQTAVPRSIVDGYLTAPAMSVAFSSSSRRAAGPREVMGAHRRRHGH